MFFYGNNMAIDKESHVITLTHLWGGQQQFECYCGESMVGPERLIKTMLMAHRMEIFPRLREALNE